ncbi:MAG: polyprenyl synthetase family protein [Chlamydiia bacterium]|nr:polyprenyl synthetase family protein [Chlamydiia bacterium]
MTSQIIEQRLDTLVQDASLPIYDAARYSLLSPGKRFRPLLVLTVAQAFQSPLSHAIDPACAIEMIHTYSLIHDDLPCMDNDDLRRGRPTLHRAFSEGLALLTGDYLLTYAFEVLGVAPHLSTEQKLKLIQLLSHAAGAQGMIGGQAIDIVSVGKVLDEPTLLQMHRGKTAALLTCALLFGAVIGNAPSSAHSLLRVLGEQLGLAFQFLDDLLDATASQEQLGKEAGGDRKKKKPTAIQFYGVDGVEKKLKELELSIEKNLAKLPCDPIALRSLIHKNLQKRRYTERDSRIGFGLM